jgi:UDP-N-acetylmuramoyl-L-alanyl-D-glutamate--2,6-diaminopimelate ligase
VGEGLILTGNIPPVVRPKHLIPVSGEELASALPFKGVVGELTGVQVSGLCVATREIEPGDAFVAIRGVNQHGAKFAEDAANAGASLIITDSDGAKLAENTGLPILVCDDPRTALGDISRFLYRTWEETPLLFGITGTNGKTSTAYLLEGILRQLGRTTGLSSTAERHIAGATYISRLTTPEASELHALILCMKEADVDSVVIEVSAQAMTHHRVDGVIFDTVGFTNLSHDHLDDYADMSEYFEAKAKLFTPEHAKSGVISLDTEWGKKLYETSAIPVTTITSESGVDADWFINVTEDNPAYTAFTLRNRAGFEIQTKEPVIGRQMAANAGLAIAMLVDAGFEFSEIESVLNRDNGIHAYLPGRTEKVSGDKGPNVYVDFGHSPDAFKQTLDAVRRVTSGKTIMLFGADGDRDATKRFDMGRIAAEGCDILVITDHHPRFEDPTSIRAQLMVGAKSVKNGPEIHEVSPPEDAIRVAVSLAAPGDSILWAGPGHQNYRDIRGIRTEYSARDLARSALKDAGWAN